MLVGLDCRWFGSRGRPAACDSSHCLTALTDPKKTVEIVNSGRSGAKLIGS